MLIGIERRQKFFDKFKVQTEKYDGKKYRRP